MTGDLFTLDYNKVGRYSQLNKNTVASTLYKYNAMGERVIKLYEPQIIEALALTEAFPILAPIIEALPAELQETIMVEFGGGGEATSNYESMPIPAIAGMTHYHYDLDHNLIAESISSGKVQKEYIYLPANLAVIADNIDMSAASALPVAHLNNTNNGSSTNETLYIINDHLRTPAKLTTSAKAVVWDRFQTPFGENAALTGTKETNIRLPGQYFDFESNYHYNLMRDYDAKTGRYLQSDPIGLAGGLNRYGYVSGNPVNRVDPSGTDYWIEGPASNEPWPHESVCVGKPEPEENKCYSFGWTGDAQFTGIVYQDISSGGGIVKNSYRRTSPAQDKVVQSWLESKVGEKSPYRPWNMCRTFSKKSYKTIKNTIGGQQ